LYTIAQPPYGHTLSEKNPDRKAARVAALSGAILSGLKLLTVYQSNKTIIKTSGNRHSLSGKVTFVPFVPFAFLEGHSV
jgi:hypothetical protein